MDHHSGFGQWQIGLVETSCHLFLRPRLDHDGQLSGPVRDQPFLQDLARFFHRRVPGCEILDGILQHQFLHLLRERHFPVKRDVAGPGSLF